MTIKTKVTRSVSKNTLRIKRNSPHIFFAAGIAGVVTSTVLACRATLRVSPLLDDISEEIDEVKKGEEVGTVGNGDVAYVYVKSAGRVLKAYAPAVVVGTASIAMLTGSHVQLTRRNQALTLAYSGLHAAYSEYRQRVRDVVGEEQELDIYHGATIEKVQDENGKTIEAKVVDPNRLSVYSRCFDEANPNWQKNAELNKIFVTVQQTYANQLLHARGYLFLNEVYNMLGMDISSTGQIVGWVVNSDGDNFVDFGIYEARNSDFINGYERSIFLDFNVDGPIIDKI